ncbi:adenylate/guanylate cyclase domain-containing protein [Hoeflea prorocentri]|uniref:Adenylate/guanylate cyclase domain-containing protein n=1 Tax=Hoeflea prorocentri TaxID=1922333 RepID=A0A9X3UK51_9HYPH|nr:adenylate/guanylate cyclase domain-containing protein [Hoeflea prorocentri]MCY6382818.1 adenylate/guanylate cyclase domain-containing protein [Hoeflea prorocentri]MDA5400618.1 adenylate/guanylate cyclase domain-containing protein [Hoeflea prorocentri]
MSIGRDTTVSAETEKRNEQRAFVIGRIVLGLSIIGHVFQVFLFIYLDRVPLTVVNVLSVAVLGFALHRLHYARRTGFAWWVFIAELLINNIITTAVLGVPAGFLVYPMIGIGLGSAIPFTAKRVRLITLLTSFTLILITIAAVATLGAYDPFGDFRTARLLTANMVNMAIGAAAVMWFYSTEIARAEDALETEYLRSEGLLLTILPEKIARRMKSGETTIADTYPDVTVLFADIAGFTHQAAHMPARDLVGLLDNVFERFDTLAETAQVEKIKTVGDAYMAVAGLPEPRPDHADAAARLALDMLAAARSIRLPNGEPLQLRIGLNSGALIGGVIGAKRMTFDLWGDVVNTASRMESTGEIGKVQISTATRQRLSPGFQIADRGTVDIKGKGKMHTWFLLPQDAK